MQLTVGLWLADGPGACGGVPRHGSVEGGGVGARVSEHFLTLPPSSVSYRPLEPQIGNKINSFSAFLSMCGYYFLEEKKYHDFRDRRMNCHILSL